jgi:hypothetical protein
MVPEYVFKTCVTPQGPILKKNDKAAPENQPYGDGKSLNLMPKVKEVPRLARLQSSRKIDTKLPHKEG